MSRDIFQDGGSAFPWNVEFQGPCLNAITGQQVPHDVTERHLFSGITTRDYFAAKAMQAFISEPVDGVSVPMFADLPDETCRSVSGAAYRLADAMLAARQK